MIDTTIGVSPPRIELNSFSDGNKKIEAKENKEDFSNYLEKSLERKEKFNKDLSDSGGTQKKNDKSETLMKPQEKLQNDVVVEEGKERKEEPDELSLNPEMILMNMVSLESASKIPNSEVNLDSLETDGYLAQPTSQSQNSLLATMDLPTPAGVDGHELLETNQNASVEVDSAIQLPQQLVGSTSPMEVSTQQTAEDADSLQVLGDSQLQFSPIEGELADLDSSAEMNKLQQLEVIPSESKPVVMSAQPNGVIDSNQDQNQASEVDSKVLETLNREQLFKKLDHLSQQAMKKENKSLEVVTQISDSTIPKMIQADETSLKDFGDSSQGTHDESFEGQSMDLSETTKSSTDMTESNQPLKQFQIDRHVALGVDSTDKTASKAVLESDSNIKEIINQAQYIVKQGGGEVTIKMTPEGMGEVQLRVMLENGKMNLQMNTQDRHVQKMIEDNLSDLKTSLASHQISVEHVTINDRMNSVQKTNTENSSQFSQFENFSRDHQQGKANWDQGQFSQNQRKQLPEERRSSDGLNREIVSTVSDVKKAVGQRVYQANKAQTLNAVA